MHFYLLTQFGVISPCHRGFSRVKIYRPLKKWTAWLAIALEERLAIALEERLAIALEERLAIAVGIYCGSNSEPIGS